MVMYTLKVEIMYSNTLQSLFLLLYRIVYENIRDRSKLSLVE